MRDKSFVAMLMGFVNFSFMRFPQVNLFQCFCERHKNLFMLLMKRINVVIRNECKNNMVYICISRIHFRWNYSMSSHKYWRKILNPFYKTSGHKVIENDS